MTTTIRFVAWLGAFSALCAVGLGCGSATDPADGASKTPTDPNQTSTGVSPATTGSTSQPGAPAPSTNPQATTTMVPPALAGAAGASPTQTTPAAPGTMPGAASAAGASAAPPGAGTPMAMNECGLHTKYPGDEYCILPPPADKGFQMHIGPKDYDNPEAKYVLAAGEETTDTFSTTSTNDKEIYFYYRQFRMRPGAHHNIITAGDAGDTGLGQRIGTVNSLAEDYPKGGIIAPENTGVGIKLPPQTGISVSLHSINTSQKTQLREIWVNFWYRDPEAVTEPVKEVFSAAPMAGILPGQDVVLNGSCNVTGNGRMLWAYGHRHANNVRFTIWRSRSGKRDLVYQGYNWEETLVLDYSSTVMNAVPDTAPNVEGGWSGILDIKSGDQFVWECHVINKTQGVLNFTNNTFTGEMCILDAETVGASCN
jgi:hypothetical protein